VDVVGQVLAAAVGGIIQGRYTAEGRRYDIRFKVPAEFIRARAEDWLRASGAERVWSAPLDLRLSASQHQAGTARLAADPDDGVTDPFGRVHGHDNLWITDGSLHVTNGGFNPALTIMALAFRAAEKILLR
jgi:choline dehydrogenase-like flavoprotein